MNKYYWCELSPCDIAWYLLIQRDYLAKIMNGSLLLTCSKAIHCMWCRLWPGREKWKPTGVEASPRPRKGLTDLLCWPILVLNCCEVFPIYWASLGQLKSFWLPSFRQGGLSSPLSSEDPSLGQAFAFFPGFLWKVPDPFVQVREYIVFSVWQLSSSVIVEQPRLHRVC